MKSNISAIDNETARKRLNILSITFAFNTLAGSIVFPFLPIYLHSMRGFPMSTVGLIFPVMGLATIIGAPFSGYSADRFGRRSVMYIGPFLRSISHFSLALMAAVNAPFIVITIGLFFAFFLGTFFQNSANAYVTDLIHADDRTLAFSKIRVGLNIGWMIGPAIGAFLARTPFFLLFLMTGSFCLVTAFTVYRWCPELPLSEERMIHDRTANISFIYVFAFLGFGVSLNWVHLILCIVLMTLAEMISIPAATAATGSLAPQDRVGRYMGLHGLVQGIGWSLGPFLGSQLFEVFAGRPLTLWAMLSFSALMASVGFLWIGFNKLPH